jgi:ATP-dependent RNA helicase DDX27
LQCSVKRCVCAVQLKQILKLTPTKRQSLLFSATMSSGVQQLIQLSLSRPVRLAADVTAATPATLRQEVVRLKGGSAAADKVPVLCALCARTLKGLRTIIFCQEKRHAHRLKVMLGLAEIAPASELHGDMTQVRTSPLLVEFLAVVHQERCSSWCTPARSTLQLAN